MKDTIMSLHIQSCENYDKSMYQCYFCSDEFFSNHSQRFTLVLLREGISWKNDKYLFEIDELCVNNFITTTLVASLFPKIHTIMFY